MSAISEMTKRSLAGVTATLQKAQQGGSLHDLAVDAIVVVSNIRGEIDETAPVFLEFVENVEQYGIQEPILVRPAKAEKGKYELIAGERRWRASRAAGKATVPAIVKHVDDGDFFMLQVIENVHRENISQLKEAEALKEALALFGSLDAVAKKWNRSKSWVSERLQLLELKPASRRLVEDSVTADMAVINAVNRAERIDAEAGGALAERVRHVEKKREVARLGLEEVKKANRSRVIRSSKSAAPLDMSRKIARLADELAASIDSTGREQDPMQQIQTTMSTADKRAAGALQKSVKTAHAAGAKLAQDWPSSLDESLTLLTGQLEGEAAKSSSGRILVLKAFALGAMKQPYEFEAIVIS